jgi:hypothetical protein
LEGTSRFSETVWRLEPALLQSHEGALCLGFTAVPAEYRPAVKHFCYLMLSGDLPPGEDRPAVSSVRKRFGEITRFCGWLNERKVSPEDIAASDVADYGRHLLATIRSSQQRIYARGVVRLLWRYREGLPGFGLAFDPLRIPGWKEPRARGQSENATDRIPEEVLGPLIAWAIRFVDEFAPDIFAANDQRVLMYEAGFPSGAWGSVAPRLRAYITDLERRSRQLPGREGRANVKFIARSIGCSRRGLDPYVEMIAEASQALGVAGFSAFLDPVSGRFNGREWAPWIVSDHTHPFGLARLMRHLQAACYILVAFLSGMRDSEIKHLKRGCLTVLRDSTGNPYRWTVRSRAFKGERDPAGVEATWVIGEPAARAIETLERLQRPDEVWLFAVLDVGPGAGPSGSSTTAAMGTDGTINQINAFTSWVADYCEGRGVSFGIPEVDGRPWRLTTRQFRRTLAWFIARRPGGSIAGAIAYRHHGIQVFEGYAGTSDSGFRGEVEAEQALRRGEVLLSMIDQHSHEEILGPSADEARHRLGQLGKRVGYDGAVVTDPRRLARVMAQADPAVYPGKYVTCVFNPEKALCDRGSAVEHPALESGHGPLYCANVALTAANLEAWRADILEADAELKRKPPLPPLLERRVLERRDAMLAFVERNSS